MKEITSRLTAFRELMNKRGIAAAIVPQADPHQGEYLAAHWQVRRWLSGFTGSAGDLVVTKNKAALWTDSRYFIQAAAQLEGSGIELMKDGIDGTPTIAQYLCDRLSEGDFVGIDGMLFNPATVESLRLELADKGIGLTTTFDVIDNIWTDRPALPDDEVFVHDVAFAGEDARTKIAKILDDAAQKGAKGVFIAMLDEIAWTLNIRSNDVRNTPVATAYLFLSQGRNILFINPAKLNDKVVAYLASQGVKVEEYGNVKEFLGKLPMELSVMADDAHLPYELTKILGKRLRHTDFSAAMLMKSVKNDVQIAGVRNAMLRDGAAMVRSLMEIERRVKDGVHTTELDVAEILRRYRSQGDYYFDESFDTIAGYGPHGAIVHYTANEESSSDLAAEGLLLIDSGAQYLDGTTDITRTICLGTPTAQEKSDFTLVMKGHIALAKAIFPAGTRGAQLDALARQFLWQHGLSYLHGTGHGVGYFLSVHEGPHSIRLNNVERPLLPGSITSNEPGVYREDVHGIRCENLVLCTKRMTTEFGDFLGFETLTLCPFDRNLFDTSMMSEAEIEWVNNYHSTVRSKLMPLMATEEEKQWLTNATEAI